MFKIALIVLLLWLAYKMFMAGRFVRGVMKNVEEVMSAAQKGYAESSGPGYASGQTASGPSAGAQHDAGRVTVHRKPGAGQSGGAIEAEDARFQDL
ncbi:MAG: hypothetical protein JJ896_10970 [Rhodothermales bacterium]|nr:hypothetical protein [Rhodothermales bacterium]MBO6780164.1 hypothetical protein [Rhodothermales bacterium]